jgi:uncharacterized membrane protein
LGVDYEFDFIYFFQNIYYPSKYLKVIQKIFWNIYSTSAKNLNVIINITDNMEETKNPNTEEAKPEAKQQPNPEIIILEFLRNNQNRFSMLELSRKTGLSYNTVQKYVMILQNKNLVDVKDFGNIKLVGFRRDQNEQQQL